MEGDILLLCFKHIEKIQNTESGKATATDTFKSEIKIVALIKIIQYQHRRNNNDVYYKKHFILFHIRHLKIIAYFSSRFFTILSRPLLITVRLR